MIWHTMFGVVNTHGYMPYFPGHKSSIGEFTICEFEEEVPKTDGLIKQYLENMKAKLVKAGFSPRSIKVSMHNEGSCYEFGLLVIADEELVVRIE